MQMVRETMPMATPGKIAQLQIRVSPAQKRQIQSLARCAGLDMSSFVLAQVLPQSRARFLRLVADLNGDRGRFALAEINDLLTPMAGGELLKIAGTRPPVRLDPYLENYLCALLETAAHRGGVAPPAWLHDIPPLPSPVFGTDLESLRLHLLTHAPAAFRRRNIFIDATLGARV